MGSDESDEDQVTEIINLEVDPSMISEITITRTGASPITVSADSASPADNEPSTLEPQLVVRGLGTPGSSPPPATFAEVGAHRDSEADDEEPEEERTTQNIESNVQAAYDRAVRAAASPSSPPLTQLSPIIMTPSEPIRLEASRTASADAARARPPAPIPAAGRPPEPEWDKELSEVTARAGPAGDLVRATAATEEDYEEETKTDAVQLELAAASRARAVTAPMPIKEQHPALEPDETRTKKAPLTMLSAQAAFLESEKPQGEPVGDESRPKLDALAAVGGTVRMFFNPATGKATAHPDSERNMPAAQRSMQPFGEQPTVQALPLQQNPGFGPPAFVLNPSAASLELTHGSRNGAPRKPRRIGRFVLLFVVACGATGAAVHYRTELAPWIIARLPSGMRAPSASAAPTTPTPEPPASVTGAIPSEEPSAIPLPAPPSTGTGGTVASAGPTSASATPSTSASGSSSAASAAAAAAASAQRGKGKKGFPPPRR